MDGIERAAAHVARRLQRLQQRGDAGLAELIASCASCSTCCACGMIWSRIADEELPLRLRALRRGCHLALDAQDRGLALRQQLVERGLLDEHAGAMRREERERDCDAGAPARSEIGLGAMGQREARRRVGHAQRLSASASWRAALRSAVDRR